MLIQQCEYGPSQAMILVFSMKGAVVLVTKVPDAQMLAQLCCVVHCHICGADKLQVLLSHLSKELVCCKPL